MAPPRRLREREARAILIEEVARIGGTFEARLVRTDGPRAEANRLEWWSDGVGDEEGSVTDRAVAYLRAYRRIAEGMEMYAAGLLLDKGRVHMDKKVIRRLYEEGYLDFFEERLAPFFRLTPAGEELVASGRR